MKRSLAVVAAVLGLSLVAAACDRKAARAPGDAPEADGPPAVAADTPPSGPTSGTGSGPGAAPSSPTGAAEPAATDNGQPAFAQIYPGAKLDRDPTTAEGAAGPGGLVTFSTRDDPDAVIAFYREHAEAAGLASVMAMNQGDNRAYGALNQSTGATVQVVATAVTDAPTSVQLTWSAGQ